MRAMSTSSGSVIFVPDEIERKTAGVSYNDITAAKPARKSIAAKLFGRRKSDQKNLSRAA